MFKNFGISLVLFLVLDWIWFQAFMQNFAREQLGGLLRFSGNELDVRLWSAALAYLFMTLMATVFLAPRLSGVNLPSAIALSALMGLLVFGVFDFTSYALFQGYPIKFALVDTLWGVFLFGVVGACLALFGE